MQSMVLKMFMKHLVGINGWVHLNGRTFSPGSTFNTCVSYLHNVDASNNRRNQTYNDHGKHLKDMIR